MTTSIITCKERDGGAGRDEQATALLGLKSELRRTRCLKQRYGSGDSILTRNRLIRLVLVVPELVRMKQEALAASQDYQRKSRRSILGKKSGMSESERRF